ncbi:hypothetical protein A2T98_03075 [Nodularia spumigena CENA596]|uniref:Uncharacterized protein n=1 Tax=Nodularia spumigena CENA596 TaxID=1819295 RepID=A0A166KKX3_NODSP|nr:anacyclamide/piricyclamide family prenylated cyclic peptide [Nodularia spumigena]KZL51261.1 hypothetical protein A2T98_03075 [Nodularia spumigena CENA596]
MSDRYQEEEFTHCHLKKLLVKTRQFNYPSKSKRLHQHSLLHIEEVKRTNKTKEKNTMTKKNIRPQQVAPVERETTATAKDQSGQVTPLIPGWMPELPFAGDDAE